MRAVFSSIVAVSLLFHAAFGCCWHHVHALDYDATQARLPAVELEHNFAGPECCGHSHDSNPAGTPCKGHPRCQGTCQYLPVPKTQFAKLAPLSTLELAAIAPTSSDLLFAAAQPHGKLLLGSPAQPPLRLHLLHQVLLI